MTTVTLPRKLVEDALDALGKWYVHPNEATVMDELRAALDMSAQSTHPENMYEFRCKIDTSENSNSVEFDRIKQNHLRSEALTHKTDWSAS